MSTLKHPATTEAADVFRHIALLYRDDDEYATLCAALVEEALARGDPALVVVPGRGGDLIRECLGPKAAGVSFKDMAVAGRNPGRIIPGVLLAFAAAHRGRHVWITGEPIWSGRSGVEYPACVAHEALINAVFAGRRATILCPYDVSRLEPAVVADAHRTHPLIQDGKGTRASPAYADPLETAAAFDLPLPAPPRGAPTCVFRDVGELPRVRAFLAKQVEAFGLRGHRTTELLIAVNELATNTTEYTRGPGTLTVWAENGSLVCHLDDPGQITDPLAGRVPPPDSATHGRGLLVVNELADLVRVHRHASGTRFRLHFDLLTR
ncbi:anti-sigma factor RsbA family regulatory protein [Sphaerimonospora thailandensis]|uniref:Anti-sigma regulatory factor n=1 Tax=Sphaerimonospora thailandensis TaxID=795644 RepID=A0A8J3VYA9_9ACTN|nr:anti-sigma factor RsbA family regulatory protein [Sphaerimonospora thailandensis]GIH69829.1 anti-sigma regulatory factor [Sphaerimonospora thailandensis]